MAQEEKMVGRRQALGLMGAGVVGAGAAATMASSVFSRNTAYADEGLTFDQTVQWDGEYDVIVIGSGFAGMTSAINASDAGATVLMLEKAPEEEAGGNSRVCHQLYGTVNDVEEGFKYFSAMRSDFSSTSDEILRTYIDGMSKLDDYVVYLGANRDEITSWAGCGITSYETEHPELPGGDAYEGHSVVPELANGALFALSRENILSRADMIDVWYETPATNLIQDPLSKTVLGVTAEYEGKSLNIRAKNGVVLACGGFENNTAMLESFLGIGGQHVVHGTTYNTGDGIAMGIAVGANLWHMHNYESTGAGGNIDAGYTFMLLNSMTSTPSIIVGPDGTRYFREAIYPTNMRHGHIYVAGDWTFPAYVEGSWGIFDASVADAADAAQIINICIENGDVIAADTIEELAELTGMTYLEDTIAIYNRYCEQGFDEAFRRPAETLLPFGEGPYYASKLYMRPILNTQGGPERDANAQIIDVFGDPIPNLYSAGELGGVTAHRYQGGCNVAECLVFGQIAGKNAAAAKETSLPALAASGEYAPVYTKGVRNDIA